MNINLTENLFELYQLCKENDVILTITAPTRYVENGVEVVVSEREGHQYSYQILTADQLFNTHGDYLRFVIEELIFELKHGGEHEKTTNCG